MARLISCITAILVATLLSFVVATPLPAADANGCTEKKRIDGVKQLIKTIGSHSAADAALIPLAPFCTRTIFISPKELGNRVQIPVNVGVDANSVRAELVGLATVIDAKVEGPVKYTVDRNGSVTADLVQLDRIVVPREPLREIHDFDLKTCLMTKITGYINGTLAEIPSMR